GARGVVVNADVVLHPGHRPDQIRAQPDGTQKAVFHADNGLFRWAAGQGRVKFAAPAGDAILEARALGKPGKTHAATVEEISDKTVLPSGKANGGDVRRKSLAHVALQ